MNRGLVSSPSALHSMHIMGIRMSAAPRKVSFEDGHSDGQSDDSVSSSCSDSSLEQNVIMPLHQQQHSEQQEHGEDTKEVRSTSSHKPRLLTRHSPSLSLVDLAKSLAMEDDSCIQTSGLSPKKRPHSAPVSPVMGPLDPERCLVVSPTSSNNNNLLPPTPGGMESTAEPWGHFVDMALPDKQQQRRVLHVPKTIPLSARGSGKSNNRKRHERRTAYANPYGEYHHKTKHPLCFQPTRSEPRLDVVVPSSVSLFQLRPRNGDEPTEQIAGDLQRLHFR